MIANQVPKCLRKNESEEIEKSRIFEQQNGPEREVENKQFFKGVFQVPQRERVNLSLINVIISEN